MSMYLTKGTCMNDRKILHQVLGTRFTEVEMHASPQQLVGYQNDKREQTAEIIVRRQYVGDSSNDIGFKKNAAGNFDAIISEFDSHKHDEKWVQALSRDYLITKAKSIMSEQEAELLEAPLTLANGDVQLKFRRSTVSA